jgi:predicted PurR-regulated permease PerM
MDAPDPRRRTLWLSAVLVAVVWLAYLARDAVVPLLVALILAYTLAPVVAALQRRGLSRVASVSLLFVAFFGTMATALIFGLPPLLDQGRSLVRATFGEPARTLGSVDGDLSGYPDASPPRALGPLVEALRKRPGWPGGEGNFERRLRELRDTGVAEAEQSFLLRHESWQVGRWKGRVIAWEDRNGNNAFDPGYIFDLTMDGSKWLRQRLRNPEAAVAAEDIGLDFGPRIGQSLAVHSGDVARGVFGVLGTALRVLGWFVIVPLFTFYFLMRLEGVWTAFVRYLPGANRARVLRVLGQIHVMLLGFFRGRLLTMVMKGVFVGLGLFAVGAPFPPVFGAAAGLLTIIPAVGPVMAAAPCVILAYASETGGGTTPAVLALIVFVLAEVVEGYVLIPKFVGREVGLHPMAVVAAILVGAALLGMLGVVLAIPLAAAANIAWREFVLPDLEAKAAEAPGAAPRPPAAP